MEKCPNCPLRTVEDKCIVQKTRVTRLCQKVDPESSAYNESYIGEIIAKSEVNMPGLLEQAMSAAKAVGSIVKNFGLDETTTEEREHRLKICESCDFFTANRRCLKCGCYMDVKTTIKAEKCPIGRWEDPKIISSIEQLNKTNTTTPTEGCGCGKGGAE